VLRRGRLLVVVPCVAAAFGAGLALASCGGDEEASDTTETTTTTTTTAPPTTATTTTETMPPPPQPTVVRIQVVDGSPQGGIVRETVDQGDRVVVQVTSDVSDHVHVHGYDLVADVGPGMRARIAFRARLPGRFVIELEDRHAQIAELTVRP
jgi:hypothetical protein